jgi:Zn ribbon nucleic-acid-binding protein
MSDAIGSARCPVCKAIYRIDLIRNKNVTKAFRCAECNAFLKYNAKEIKLIKA